MKGGDAIERTQLNSNDFQERLNDAQERLVDIFFFLDRESEIQTKERRSRKVKRKIFSILFALVLVVSFSLVTAVPATAEPGEPEAELAGSYSYSWTTSIMESTDFDFTVGMGWSGPFSWPPNVYYFFHPDEIPPGGYAEPIGGAWLFENIDFDETTAGQTFSVTSVADDPNFEDFASLLTNGTDETVWFGYMGDREDIASAGGQKGVQESQVFSGTDVGTDFPGWVIQSISLTFNQIYLDPDNVNKLVLDFTINIYASPPTEVWVDDDASLGWYADPTNFDNIPDAIGVVAESGTVNVAAGTYDEVVLINKPLQLLGAQAGVDARTRNGPESVIDPNDPSGGAAKSWVVRVQSSDVTVDGFTVQNPTLEYGSAGLFCVEATEANPYQNLVFRNNILQNPGIKISPSTDWGKFGYDIGYCDNVLIEYNYIRDILCDTATPWNGTAGIWPWNTNDLTIRYNKIEHVTTFGIGLSDTNNNVLIIENEVSLGDPGEGAVPSVRTAGIRVGPVENYDVRIEGNSVSDCPGTVEKPGAGIRIQSHLDYGTGSTLAIDNVVTGCPVGIDARNHLEASTLIGNTISGCDVGIRVAEGAATPQVESNIFEDNNPIQVLDDTMVLDIQAVLDTNTFDRAVVIDHPEGSLLHTIWSKIQDAIDSADPGDTINVAAGTYEEAISITKPLTLLGATSTVPKDGYPVPVDYAWDDTIESVISHPSPSGGYTAIVDIVDVDDVIFKGFVIQELNAVGNLNASLVRVYAYTREISNIVVSNNVIGPNTNTTAQDGAQGRMGLYIVNHPYGDQGVVNSTFSGNKIFDCKGNGNNVFIWSSYYEYGAPGPASMSGTVIEANEIYGSHRSGIETAGGYSGLTIRNNQIYGQKHLAGEEDALKYGNGILLIRGSSDKVGGPTTAYGPENLTIENNEIYDNDKNGIYAGPINKNYVVTGNDIHGNGWDGIRVDLDGNYWNPTFEPSPTDWSCYDGSENIDAHFNNIYDNAAGVQVIGTPTNGFVLDATNNWWDDASGPIPPGTYESYGDKVSDNVDYEPWLLKEVTPGVEPTTYDKTLALKDGWTLVSTDKALSADRVWVGVTMAYKYAPTIHFEQVDDLAGLEPLTAMYVKTDGGGGVGFDYAEAGPGVIYSKELEAGWNLISIPSISGNATTGAILSPLRYVTIGTQQGVGLATLVSQGDYNQFSGSFYLATLTDANWDSLVPLDPFDGYWAYMNAAKTFEVIPD